MNLSTHVFDTYGMKKALTTEAMIFQQKVILWLSLPLMGLLVLCSAVGLLYPSIYTGPSSNWITQAVVQDGVDLFIVAPVLIVASLYSYQGIKTAIITWGGTVSYLVYTFLIYCFSVPFNILFLAYCLILGLSIFSLAWFFFIQIKSPVVSGLSDGKFVKVTGTYFILVAVLFYILWLVDILPASFSQTRPRSLDEVALLTNPVHVLDLSVVLPCVFIAGLMTMRLRPFAAILVPVVLVFFILMDITIAALTVVMMREGFGGSIGVAVTMATLGMFSLCLLLWFVWISRDELSN